LDPKFYRLNVFPIEVPPLRERKDDIPMLVEYFINCFAKKTGKKIRKMKKSTLDRLESYSWPGNLRELQNVIERSSIVSDSEERIVDEVWLNDGTDSLSTRYFEPSFSVNSGEKEMIESSSCSVQG
jgi:transcriptional regulator with PAS, ATPase and Fis domain